MKTSTYRTVSVLAIVSLLLGLASPLSLFASLLYLVPIAGTLVSLLAIARIDGSEGSLIGRKAALVGLALCVGSLSMSLARSSISQSIYSRQARNAAEQWISALRSGDVQQAFALTTAATTPPSSRPAPGSLPTEPPRSPVDVFREQPVVHFLLDHAQDSAPQYVGEVSFERTNRGEMMVTQRYLFTPKDSDPIPIDLYLARSGSNSLTPGKWLVANSQSDSIQPHVHADEHQHEHQHEHHHDDHHHDHPH